MAFLLRYMPGLRLDDVWNMSPCQLKAYTEATVKLLKAENGTEKDGKKPSFGEDGKMLIDDDKAKKLVEQNVNKLKKKHGANYKPQLTDLFGTGII